MGKILISLVLLSLILGIRFFFYVNQAGKLEHGHHFTFTQTLFSDTTLSGRSQRFSLRVDEGERIFITTSRFPVYSYGQQLEVQGNVEKTELGDGSFIWTMSYPKIDAANPTNPVVRVAQSFRTHVTRVFAEYLPFPSSSLLIGIVFGIKEGMPDSLTDKLSRTGIIHITAASGMNITLLAGAVFLIFGRLFHRRSAILLSLIIVWMYALIAGFDASIVRASIMASIAFTAGLIGRQNAGWYALIITAFVMLFIRPANIFDLGFQLSLASTAGILFLVPLMGTDKRKVAELWFISDDFKATTAAQIATIPILLSNFGGYGPFSILINLLVLWEIPFLMMLGGIASLLSFIHPVLAAPFLYLTLPFLVYMEAVVDLSSRVFPLFQADSFPLSLSIGYYLIFIAISIFLYRKRQRTE